MNKFSDDQVLLKLHRRYGMDEAVKYLFDEISSLRFQIGELKSENAELKHENGIVKGTKQWSKDEYVQELKEHIKLSNKVKQKAKKETIEWRNKYFDLLAKSTPSPTTKK